MYQVIISKEAKILLNKCFNSIEEISFSEEGFEDFDIQPNNVLAQMYVEGIASHYNLFSKESCEAVENLHKIISNNNAKEDFTLIYKGKPFLVNLYGNLNGSFSYADTTDDGWFIFIANTDKPVV